jgi:hypothetical protein
MGERGTVAPDVGVLLWTSSRDRQRRRPRA